MATDNDIVLVYLEDQPIFFARIEAIWPDVKKDWFNIELLVLQIPLKTIIWTLKDAYINGTEFFMGGKKMKMEAVKAPPHEEFDEAGLDDQPQSDEAGTIKELKTQPENGENRTENNESVRKDDEEDDKGGRVISLADFQKKKRDQQ